MTSFSAPGINRSYAYDGVGNLNCLSLVGESPCTRSASDEVFGYDFANRLTKMTINGVAEDQYVYDAMNVGVLLSKAEGLNSSTLTYGSGSFPAHAPVSVTTGGTTVPYTYDKAGNLIGRAGTTYTYDAQDHLTQVNQSVNVTQFRYDGEGTLAQRVDSAGAVTYPLGDIEERNLTAGTVTERYYLGSRLVATRDNTSFSYVYQDYLHSTDSAHTVGGGTATTEYTPYGLPRSSSGTLPTDRQFQGQQNQASVGLYHMGARWYDPAIGLWTQPDTIVPNPADPLAFNRYSFVEGNPLRYWDPTGHNRDFFGDAAENYPLLHFPGGGLSTGEAGAAALGVDESSAVVDSAAADAAAGADAAAVESSASQVGTGGNAAQINAGISRLNNTANSATVPNQFRYGANAELTRVDYWKNKGTLQGVEVTEDGARYDLTLTTNNDIVEVKYWSSDYTGKNYGQLLRQLQNYQGRGKSIILEMFKTQSDPLTDDEYAALVARLQSDGINLDPSSQLLGPLPSDPIQ